MEILFKKATKHTFALPLLLCKPGKEDDGCVLCRKLQKL